MYEEFYGFRERPFDLTPDPRTLYLTEHHREALSNLEYAFASRKGITLLLGQAGSGKTTVIRTALDRQTSQVHCVHLMNPALTRDEFVQMLALRFDLSQEARASKTVMLHELEELLQRRHEAKETTVLLIDEAQSLSRELLEEVRLLANIETNHEKLLSLVIAGQPELADLLNQPDLRQLKQRVALRCELRPLSESETATYLAVRIRAAGGVPMNVFTREAALLLHERSMGIPRTINVLADNALLAGFAAGQRRVNAQIVTEVGREFDFGAGAGALDNEPAHEPWESAQSTMAPAAPRPAPPPSLESEQTNNSVAERIAARSISGDIVSKRRRFSFLGWGRSA